MKLIKSAFTVVLLSFAGMFVVKAQTFQEGDIAISAGYGFPSIAKKTFDFIEGENLTSAFIGPFFGKLEYAISESVGFGLHFAYARGTTDYTRTDNVDSITYYTGLDYTSYSIFARINWHFGNLERFDPYAGFGMGYRNASYKYTGNDPQAGTDEIEGLFNFGLDFTIGARLYLTDNIGVFGEVGIAKTPFQLGLVARF